MGITWELSRSSVDDESVGMITVGKVRVVIDLKFNMSEGSMSELFRGIGRRGQRF